MLIAPYNVFFNFQYTYSGTLAIWHVMMWYHQTQLSIKYDNIHNSEFCYQYDIDNTLPLTT